ncbi:hypothetical protein MA16_Dca024372 [Dendrobium catenatum]|uniref:Uncharacterized protein n=1 Tax=Dendrobium catenatum TaxID=906689 RepID=A0A2I0VXE8_9ASPA|nr:hypothetical protein MA16_Dca024372 [Dendrobium catenatum]
MIPSWCIEDKERVRCSVQRAAEAGTEGPLLGWSVSPHSELSCSRAQRLNPISSTCSSCWTRKTSDHHPATDHCWTTTLSLTSAGPLL